MKKSLLILIALFISLLGYSQTFTDNFITYTAIPSTTNVEITSYDATAGGLDVNIPPTVSNGPTTYNVTKIGQAAFSNKQLNSVVFPNSLTDIGDYAFNSNQLLSVTIPNAVTYIGTQAFANNQLNSVILSSNLSVIALGAFSGNSLTTITIPATITLITRDAFSSNPLLTSVISLSENPPFIYSGTNDPFDDRSIINLTIPFGKATIYTNQNWIGFNSVIEAAAPAVGDTFVNNFITYEVTTELPNTVEILDYDVSGGTVVNIHASVSFSGATYDVTSIGENAFALKQITSVTIPNGITSIKHHAFNSNQLTSVVIPESVTDIDYLAFSNNSLNTVVVLGTTPPIINTSSNVDTFGTSSRANIYLILTGNTTDEYVTDSGALWTGFKMVFEATSATTAKVTDYEAANGAAVTIPASISIPNVTVFNVTEIGESAFYDKGLTDVTIPEGVTTIGTSAFEINNLTSVSIPDSVTSIGLTAFSTNSISNLSLGINVDQIGVGAFVDNNLTDLTIPSNVTYIGLLAFGNNPSLASVTSLAMVPPTITTGANDTFIFNRGNTALNIPAGTMGAYVTDAGALWTGFNPVTEIGGLAVGDTFVEGFITYEVTSITPDTVEAIDYDVAGGNMVNIPATVPNTTFSVTSIGDTAFKDKSITNVTLPNSILSLGFEAFRNNSLQSITLPNSLTSIGDYVFIGNQLTSIIIPDSVTEIGAYAFLNNSLTSATLPSGITNIAIGTFEDNSLSSITIPNGVTSIDNAAFKNNALTSITIPSSVTSIDIQVFRNNPLNSVTSLATTPPTITTGGNNDSFSSNRSNIYLTIPNGTENDYIAAQWINFASVTLNTSDFELADDVKVVTTTDAIKIIASNNIKLENYTLYTIAGCKVAAGIEHKIPTSYLASGIYILKLDFNKGTVIKKVAVN